MTHSLKSHQVEMPDFTAVRGVYIINILNLTEFPQEIQLCSLDRFSPGGVCGLGTKKGKYWTSNLSVRSVNKRLIHQQICLEK